MKSKLMLAWMISGAITIIFAIILMVTGNFLGPDTHKYLLIVYSLTLVLWILDVVTSVWSK